MKIKAGIVGATGYAGAELVRLLTAHPEAEISAISSVSFEGDKLSDVYPSYTFLKRAMLSLPLFHTVFHRSLPQSALMQARHLLTSALTSALKAKKNTPNGTVELFLTKNFTNRQFTDFLNFSEIKSRAKSLLQIRVVTQPVHRSQLLLQL